MVAIDTEPGDLTVHYGDTMHTTPAPRSPAAGRRALYYKFAEPKTFEWVPAGCHYNDVLFRADDTGRIPARATSWQTDSPSGARAAWRERRRRAGARAAWREAPRAGS